MSALIDGPCPFDHRLARTPYLVLPKLAIQVMPMEWRLRFEELLVEAENAGLETPAYDVVVEGGTIERAFDDELFEEVAIPSIDDPWADYRHMQIEKVKALCPAFKLPGIGEGGEG